MHKRWNWLAVGAIATTMGLFSPLAYAARVTTSISLDAGAAWTFDSNGMLNTAGDSTTVETSSSISVEMHVTTSGISAEDDWESSSWRIALTAPGTTICVNTGDHSGDGAYTETFSITAPATGGTYNVYLLAHDGNSCGNGNGGASPVVALVGAVVVQEPPQCNDPEDCNDNNACTVDSCVAGLCVHTLIPGCVSCGDAIDADIYLMMDRTGSTSPTSLANERVACKTLLAFFDDVSSPPPLAIGTLGCNGTGFPGGQACTLTSLSNSQSPAPYGDDDAASDGDHYAWIDQATSIQSSVGTHFLAALQAVSAEFAAHSQASHKILIFVSDGANQDDFNATVAEANALKTAGTEIFTILFPPSASPPTPSDVQVMTAIATDASHYFLAPDSSDLSEIFDAVTQQIGCSDDDSCTADSCVDGACQSVPKPDVDSDGICDEQDGCPNDPDKTSPGLCGCGEIDIDCNTNGICDADETGNGSADDCNTNSIPDECETDSDGDGVIDPCDGCPTDPNKAAPGICGCDSEEADCNTNGVCDTDDIEEGTSQDCDSNGVPDECQPDSDSDGVINPCDGCPNDEDKTSPGLCGCGEPDLDCNTNEICDADETGNGSAGDCDSNSIPDECEADSDSDGLIDECDLCPTDAEKTEPGLCGCGNEDLDCNTNGVCDTLDVQGGSEEGSTSNDCNTNVIPDECETDTDGDGTIDDCDQCPTNPDRVEPGPCGCSDVQADCNTNGVCDGSDIFGGTSQDCDGNLVPDECQPDSDSDGTIDPCDDCPLDANKTSPGICGCGEVDVDCNSNGVCDTDELGGDDGESDCNSNQAPDGCEQDSDGDGTIDDCDGCPENPEVTQPDPVCGCAFTDCNTNGVCDTLDVHGGDEEGSTSNDCNTNVIPDECETDTDGDGTIDECDQCPTNSEMTVPDARCGCSLADCNTNGVCDGLDIAAGTSQDCNSDVAPDECEADSDSDGVIDDCDQCPANAAKTTLGLCGCNAVEADCNGNEVCDSTDIATGASEDCNTNGIPDDCETDSDDDGTIDPCDECPQDGSKFAPGLCGCGQADLDCNTNGVCDTSDIAGGASKDCNTNGVPDECEPDSDGDGVINVCDACPSEVGTQADGCPEPPGPQPTPGACILGSGDCIITIEGDCVAQGGAFQGAGTTCPEPPGTQPIPPCDPTAGGLNFLFSLFFHSPICGGCPIMIGGTMFFLVMFRAGYRRRGRRV